MAHVSPEELNAWLRVHSLSLTQIQGGSQKEFLLELGVAPIMTTDGSQEGLSRPQFERLVLGPDAASILLRLLMDAGVSPKGEDLLLNRGH